MDFRGVGDVISIGVRCRGIEPEITNGFLYTVQALFSNREIVI